MFNKILFISLLCSTMSLLGRLLQKRQQLEQSRSPSEGQPKEKVQKTETVREMNEEGEKEKELIIPLISPSPETIQSSFQSSPSSGTHSPISDLSDDMIFQVEFPVSTDRHHQTAQSSSNSLIQRPSSSLPESLSHPVLSSPISHSADSPRSGVLNKFLEKFRLESFRKPGEIG